MNQNNIENIMTLVDHCMFDKSNGISFTENDYINMCNYLRDCHKKETNHNNSMTLNIYQRDRELNNLYKSIKFDYIIVPIIVFSISMFLYTNDLNKSIGWTVGFMIIAISWIHYFWTVKRKEIINKYPELLVLE